MKILQAILNTIIPYSKKRQIAEEIKKEELVKYMEPITINNHIALLPIQRK